MVKYLPTSKSSFGIAFGLFGFIKKYWYWFILFLVLLPSVITSVQTAIETNNPSYPFFKLATRIFVADQELEQNIEILRFDPSQLVGRSYPEDGVWNNVVYFWLFFWRVLYEILGNVWLIFFPLVLIYKFIRGRNVSEPYKNTTKAIFYFLLYLFITNTIILIYGITIGNTLITLPENMTEFSAYWIIFQEMIPLHGIGELIRYLIIDLPKVK